MRTDVNLKPYRGKLKLIFYTLSQSKFLISPDQIIFPNFVGNQDS